MAAFNRCPKYLRHRGLHQLGILYDLRTGLSRKFHNLLGWFLIPFSFKLKTAIYREIIKENIGTGIKTFF
jgi:hypothetical protein